MLADLMTLHAPVCFQVLSMVEEVLPAGMREEERPPPPKKLPCPLLSPGALGEGAQEMKCLKESR